MSADPTLAELEARILNEANRLDIGPMGFSGRFTLGCCKIGKLNRLPASFSFRLLTCAEAYRRRGMVLDTNGNVVEWLYQGAHEFQKEETNSRFEAAPPAKLCA
jgi:fumarate hydratase class I